MKLSGRIDGVSLVASVQRSAGKIGVALRKRRTNLIDADASRGERIRVDLNANGILLRSVHIHLGNAIHCGDALRNVHLRVLINFGKRQVFEN